MDSKLALLFEITNNIGYHSSIDPLIEQIINSNIDKLSLNDKYALFGIFYQIKNIQGTIKFGESLLINHYDNDLSDINTQKYIADILYEVMDTELFIEFCIDTFKSNKIEGMLYTLVNVYQIEGNYDKAIEELDKWLIYNPSNQRMKNKRQKVLENRSVQ